MTDLGEIALTHQEFLRRIPEAARPAGLDGRYQTDYALTRLVAANCAAVGDHANKDNPTPLVVKGGFAVRHLYGGPRYSKDADLAMVSDELELEGPQLMKWPSDMTAQETVGQGLASWILFIRYRATSGERRSTQCDLNDRSRAIRRRPPQQRLLNSLFLDSFMVWAATTEEIIGEKLYALMDHGAIRIKDVFDLRHILRLDGETIVASACREIYEACREAKGGKGPPMTGVPAAIEALSKTDRAVEQWKADVTDSVPDAPSLEDATSDLIALLGRRILMQ